MYLHCVTDGGEDSLALTMSCYYLLVGVDSVKASQYLLLPLLAVSSVLPHACRITLF